MASFVGPIDVAGWTLTTPGVVDVPAHTTPVFRYAGLHTFALQAQRADTAPVVIPAPSIVQIATVSDTSGQTVTAVEIQLNAFALRSIASTIPFGLPTFYFLFATGTTVTGVQDGDLAAAGDMLAAASSVQILCVGQDRTARDPALWSAQILAAIPTADASSWSAFATAVAQQTAGGAQPPVLLLDHRGLPRGVDDDRRPPGSPTKVEITSSTGTVTAEMAKEDGGDLQRTVARLHAADSAAMPLTGVFDASGEATIRPVPQSDDVQLARVDDPATSGAFAAGEIALTRQTRHLTFTDLGDWFQPQTATGLATGHNRYTRGNKLTPFVNGPAYYDVLFGHLNTATGLHVIGGWATFPDVELTRPPTDSPNPPSPVTLAQVATAMGNAGGGARFLSPQFFQLEQGSPIRIEEVLGVDLILIGLAAMRGSSFARTDAGGMWILMAMLVINGLLTSWLLDENARPFEPSKDAVEVLGQIPGTTSVFCPYPATVEDNPLAPLTSDLFTQLFQTDRHFGIYHQKLALVLDQGTHLGYCGGIDFNPNRLDDARHLLLDPFHDVHTEVFGPAVYELELSFQERWTQDGGGTSLAYDPLPPAAGAAPVGSDAVQVARTYFKPADPSRELAFATEGDDTIRRTLLQTISNAQEFIMVEDQYFTPPQEYTDALADKVGSGDISTLLIVLTGVTDQPFGEAVRSGSISKIQAADPGGVVRIGYLRRHFTLPDNELRASSGRLLLMADISNAGNIPDGVVLGPKSRVPPVPFWFAIEGELMYAYDEAASSPPGYTTAFQVLRGPDTGLIQKPAAGVLTPRTRGHSAGCAVTVVDLAGIYVHSKLTIVDDVFMSIGSANVDRRGFYHDGELQVFSVPEPLKASAANPVAALRRQIWAEVLNLPLSTAAPLLADPHDAAALFDRSPLLGNRFTPIDAYPAHLMFDAIGGDGLVGLLLKLGLGTLETIDQSDLYDGVVDPTSALDPQA
jgi:phosphatidylserine/phosphatidylglycerophosphate/cardiolipin synthase-like enzyme